MSELVQTVQAIAGHGRITADDVRAMRRAVYSDGGISRNEAEAIFALDEKAAASDPAWGEFFIEALSDYLVRQEAPVGYVNDANAAWLISCIARNGVVKTETELELLVRIMEIASDCPLSLAAFALDQVKKAVIDGEGPLARGGDLTPGVINEAEVELLRRILWAGAGDGRNAISRQEAEVMFDLNDASESAGNHPAWTDLFTKCVANSVLCASGYAPPPREVALARGKWLDEPTPGIGGFLSGMFGGGLKGILDAYSAPSDEDEWGRRNAAHVAESAAASSVRPDEAAWLVERIQRSGGMGANEAALLRFIAAESRDIHPTLRPLIQQAA